MTLSTEEWLAWLGVRDPQVQLSEIQADIDRLKDSVGDWSAFETLVSNSADYSELETNLVNEGFPSAKVSAFIQRIQQQFASYSDFQDTVVNTLTSYAEFRAQFDNLAGVTGSALTAGGEPAAGVRVHDSAGTSYAGVDVPAGTVEVFGRRIEFSQQDPQTAFSDVDYSNLRTDDPDDVVPVQSTLTVSADVTNPDSKALSVAVPLIVDGGVEDEQTVRIGAGETITADFELLYFDYESILVTIGTLSPIRATWVPAQRFG